LKLARVYKLDLGNVAPPPWIGELEHLRTIQCRATMKKLPSVLATLPRLAYLHLEDTGLESLDGLEQLTALDTITFGRTPVQQKAEHVAEIAKRIGGIADSWTIRVKRTPAKPKGDIATQLGDLPERSNLQKVNLKGKTFEDLYVTHDLRGANLAGTTWRRCDFKYAQLAGADLTGATFDGCYFSSVYSDEGTLGKVKAAGATFVRCGGSLDLAGATLADARLVELESDTHVDLSKANAQGLVLEVAFCSEKEHAIKATGANLRGATITFDITDDRRAEIQAKPKSKYAWKTDHLKGAKTDKTTQVTYVPLGEKKSPSTVDPKGKAAKALTTLAATNAGLWALAIDSADAAAWTGNDGDDFDRAMTKSSGAIKVGKSSGVLFDVGDNGWTQVWEVEGGIALVYAHMQVKSDERERVLGLRVAQWPAPKKQSKIGRVTVKSGALALLLPYEAGDFPPAALKKKACYRDNGGGRVLVPLPNGTYEITSHVFGPPGSDSGYEDETGQYFSCTRITRAR
jgi:uncharacterized protein YjbI with pentapeptide repeats